MQVWWISWKKSTCRSRDKTFCLFINEAQEDTHAKRRWTSSVPALRLKRDNRQEKPEGSVSTEEHIFKKLTERIFFLKEGTRHKNYTAEEGGIQNRRRQRV